MVVCSNHAISGIKEENTVKRGRRQHIPSPLLLNSVSICLMMYGCKVSYYSASLEVRKDLEYHFYSEGSSIKLLFGLTLCHPIDFCMLGFPVFHRLPEFAQTRPLSQ